MFYAPLAVLQLRLTAENQKAKKHVNRNCLIFLYFCVRPMNGRNYLCVSTEYQYYTTQYYHREMLVQRSHF